MYHKVKKFITDVLSNKEDLEKMVLKHLLDTEKYVIVLYDKIIGKVPSEELLIASLGHDIERAFREVNVYEKMYHSANGFLDENFLKSHQERSAEILTDFLKKNKYPPTKIEKIYKLVRNHETGGDFDTDILKDADSISFFINNAYHFIKVKTKESSVEKVKEKLHWMFNRITFPIAKEIIEADYRNAIKILEEKNESDIKR